MADLPFLHPALIGVGVAAALAWAALVPDRFRSPWLAAACGLIAAAIAGIAGFVPWTGALRMTAYGGMLLLAFAAGWWIMARRGSRLGIDGWFVREQLAIAAVAGILGARIWYVVEYRHEFPSPIGDFPAWLAKAADLDRGGAVWFGGLVLAAAAMVVHARRNRVALLPWADCAAPAVIAGLAIGRIGCFLNGCCYGRHCELPWAVTRKMGDLVVEGEGGHSTVKTITDTVHPTQLYETAACAVLAAVLMRIAPGNGRATGWALIGYACWRAVNETLRGDYAVRLGSGFSLSPFHLTSAQWTALPLAALGGWLVWRARRAGPASNPAAASGAG